MAYASVSHLRQLTNFSKELVPDSIVQAYVPFVDKMIIRNVSTLVYLEKLSGDIDGSNTYFRTKYKPLADINRGNLTLVDSCNVATGWTKGGDGGDPGVAGALVYGSHCLSLAKSGSSTTSASFTKTLSTAVDGTDCRLKITFYLKDVEEFGKASALTIRIGADASNYYQRVFRREELHNGIFEVDLKIDIKEMALTGTVALTALDYLYIDFSTKTIASTIAAGNVKMDYWRLENPDVLDTTDLKVYYATLQSTENKILYGSVQTLSAVLAKEGRVTVSTAPTTTTASQGVFGTYRYTAADLDEELVKLAATYLLAHFCSFIIAGNAPNMSLTTDAFLRRDIAGAPDEWLRLAISTINEALGPKEIGLRDVKDEVQY